MIDFKTMTDFKAVPMIPEIHETIDATEPYEDWSACRSKARARRRLKRGFPQRVVQRQRPTAFKIGNVIHVHPEIMRRLRAQLGEHIDAVTLSAMYGRVR